MKKSCQKKGQLQTGLGSIEEKLSKVALLTSLQGVLLSEGGHTTHGLSLLTIIVIW
jgi:hypothetical protein